MSEELLALVFFSLSFFPLGKKYLILWDRLNKDFPLESRHQPDEIYGGKKYNFNNQY